MKVIRILILLEFLGITFLSYAHQDEHSQVIKERKICPVMGNPISEEYSYTYKGKTYYFCCPMCVEKFPKDPEKYISKIKEIKLESFKYGFSPQVIKVKKGSIVRLIVTSRDVDHGVYIKEYGINIRAEKGKVNIFEFLADKSGEFPIRCSVYCGPGHSKMKAKLIVEE